MFNEFKPRRLYYVKETGSQFVKVRVIGGRLDAATTSNIESTINTDLKWIEELTEPITIVGLTSQNLLFVWRELDPAWRCINWSGGKQLRVIDFDLNKHGVIVATDRGLCYKASFKSSNNSTSKVSQTQPHQFLTSSSQPQNKVSIN